MSSFWKNYALVYFMKNRKQYSYLELARQIGLSLESVDEIINELISEGMLAYNEKHMLSLTETGRFEILNQREELLVQHTGTRKSIVDTNKAMPIDKVYFPDKFLSKL